MAYANFSRFSRLGGGVPREPATPPWVGRGVRGSVLFWVNFGDDCSSRSEASKIEGNPPPGDPHSPDPTFSGHHGNDTWERLDAQLSPAQPCQAPQFPNNVPLEHATDDEVGRLRSQQVHHGSTTKTETDSTPFSLKTKGK